MERDTVSMGFSFIFTFLLPKIGYGELWLNFISFYIKKNDNLKIFFL
jgi:hypothetical protein